MADRSITFTLLGNAAAAVKAFGDVDTKVGGLSKTFKAIGTVAGVALAGVAGAILKTGFNELEDAQAGAAQLAAGIKSTGGAAGVSVGQLEKLASSIQGYSGQTDDSIVASEKLLLTFTSIKDATGANNDIFTQATKISADMAARMGGDASASAIQLGKALNDPVQGISALTRVGVSFTDGQKKQIAALQASGNTLGAQKIILAELNKEFGGSAKAAGETLPGQLARAKRSFEDVSQSIVEKLLPVVTATFGFIQNNMSWIQPLGIGLGAIAAAVVLVSAGMKAWTIATEAWSVVTKAASIAQALFNAVMATNPVAVVILAIAALAAGLIYAYKHSETFRDIVQSVFKAVQDAASFMYDNVIHPIFTGLSATWDLIWSAVKTNWDTIGHPMFDVLSAVVSDLGSAFSTVWGGIQTVIQNVWKFVKPILDAMTSAIDDAVGAVKSVSSFVTGPVISGSKIDQARATAAAKGGLSTAKHFAAGGLVPGTGTGDTVPALLTPGEFVVPRGQVGAAAAAAPQPINVQIDGRTIFSFLLAEQRNGKVLAINRNGQPLGAT